MQAISLFMLVFSFTAFSMEWTLEKPLIFKDAGCARINNKEKKCGINFIMFSGCKKLTFPGITQEWAEETSNILKELEISYFDDSQNTIVPFCNVAAQLTTKNIEDILEKFVASETIDAKIKEEFLQNIRDIERKND